MSEEKTVDETQSEDAQSDFDNDPEPEDETEKAEAKPKKKGKKVTATATKKKTAKKKSPPKKLAKVHHSPSSNGNKNSIYAAAQLLKNAADPTRLAILTGLADGARNVGDLCTELGMSQPAVSHHIALLRHSSLIEAQRQGKNVFYSLTESGQALGSLLGTLVTE